MADLGFDHETIGKVTGVLLRTINDIANRRGYWAYTAEFDELRESYRLHLRKFILDVAIKKFAALAYRCGHSAGSLAGLFRGKIDNPLDFFERVRSCKYHNEDRSAVAIPYRSVIYFYQAELHYFADSNSSTGCAPVVAAGLSLTGGSGRHQDVKRKHARRVTVQRFACVHVVDLLTLDRDKKEDWLYSAVCRVDALKSGKSLL
jgi:hypothetical protein